VKCGRRVQIGVAPTLILTEEGKVECGAGVTAVAGPSLVKLNRFGCAGFNAETVLETEPIVAAAIRASKICCGLITAACEGNSIREMACKFATETDAIPAPGMIEISSSLVM
jgi:hypothetical protein